MPAVSVVKGLVILVMPNFMGVLGAADVSVVKGLVILVMLINRILTGEVAWFQLLRGWLYW